MAQIIRKAQPNIDEVHIDKPLTNISIAYIQDTSDFIAGEVFPNVPVEKRSDKYYTYDKNDWFRDEAEIRPDATETAGGGYSLSTDSYFADVWGYHKDIGAQTASNSDPQLNDFEDATEFVTHKLLLRKERLFVENYFGTSIWDTDKTGGADGTSPDFVYWDDYTNSTPVLDISDYKRAVKKATGFMPNTFVIGGEVWDKLRTHPDIIELIKYTQSAISLSPTLVAQALGVDKMVIAEGIYATNDEGDTAAYDQIVGNSGMLLYVNPRPAMRRPSAGYTFAWRGYGGQNAYGVTIGRFYMQSIKATRIEGEMAFDMKVVGSDLGMFLNGLTS